MEKNTQRERTSQLWGNEGVTPPMTSNLYDMFYSGNSNLDWRRLKI